MTIEIAEWWKQSSYCVKIFGKSKYFIYKEIHVQNSLKQCFSRLVISDLRCLFEIKSFIKSTVTSQTQFYRIFNKTNLSFENKISFPTEQKKL